MFSILYPIDPLKPETVLLRQAARFLIAGELVVFPTETVYGLGANALDNTAVARVFSAKGRPADNPLIVHVSSVCEAEKYCILNDSARKLASVFWPGPLTIVVPSSEKVGSLTRCGLSTVAIRMPAHPVALALIEACGFPLAAPSANRSGRPSPTDAGAVLEDIEKKVALILDAGPTQIGVESTVLDLTGEIPVVLRPGGLAVEDIIKVTGDICFPGKADTLSQSPGTRYRHYAPEIPLILWRGVGGTMNTIGTQGKKWAYIGIQAPPGTPVMTLQFQSKEEYARSLFKGLRILEKTGAELIVAELADEEGIGRAINDRLRRASIG